MMSWGVMGVARGHLGGVVREALSEEVTVAWKRTSKEKIWGTVF